VKIVSASNLPIGQFLTEFSGQTSLPDTCPVCAHTPISPDLCKPNKALRTTLKAFLRTEEKKREKERQAALPAPANDAPPAEEAPVKQDPQPESHAVEGKPAEEITLPASGEPSLEVQADNGAPVSAETDGPGIDQDATNGNTQVRRFITVRCSGRISED
jgi:hypothetical protein